MSTVISDVSEEDAELAAIELDAMKANAVSLGLKFHPNIGVENLAARIAEKIEANRKEEEAKAAALAAQNEAMGAIPTPVRSRLSYEAKRRISAKAAALKLVRIRISPMDPMKQQHDGEIFTTGNSVVGTVKKYVHFGVLWYVPQILLNMLKAKRYQAFNVQKLSNGKEKKVGKLVPAYSIETLPDLTPAELAALAQRQIIERSIDEVAI